VNKIATLCTLAVSLAASADAARAVSLNANGLGQVLIYPYYTVNAGQQTLLTIVNASDAGKMVQVSFREAYNGRVVLDFDVFLSRHDVWTAAVFKLSDAGLPGTGAAILSNDNTCTAPQLPQGPLPNGSRYQQFLNSSYTHGLSDTGPTDDSRTNEGHFEVIAMADIVAGSPLDQDITHVNGIPPHCDRAQSDAYSGVVPTSGLFGSASIVDVAKGTFFAYNAEALEGFTVLPFATQFEQPSLASANDLEGVTVTARQIVGGATVASVFPATRRIDAVSALFAADALYNEYVISHDSSVGTDWVVTFPTKHFYVDTMHLDFDGALTEQAEPPFTHRFGARESGNGPGLSCNEIALHVFDREEGTFDPAPCTGVLCPPKSPPAFCYETNVARFSSASVLGSQLGPLLDVTSFSNGLLQIDLASSVEAHDMNASSNGNVFHGLPAIGFAVTKFVNGNVPLSNGLTALANYTAAYRHRATTSCSNAAAACSQP